MRSALFLTLLDYYYRQYFVGLSQRIGQELIIFVRMAKAIIFNKVKLKYNYYEQ